MAAPTERIGIPLGSYYSIVSKLAKFLRFLCWGLSAAFALWLAVNIATHVDILLNAPTPVLGIEAFVDATIMPLMWLLAVIFAVKILSEIFSAEASAIEEHIREMLLGELLLRGRIRLDEAAQRYGFSDRGIVVKILREAAQEHGIEVKLDYMANELYLA